MLREECRLPFGVIQRYLKWRYGLRLSVGELAALTHGAAERGQEEYAGLRQEILASPVRSDPALPEVALRTALERG